jgi:hypothetical protein
MEANIEIDFTDNAEYFTFIHTAIKLWGMVALVAVNFLISRITDCSLKMVHFLCLNHWP